ncbi:GNAT family N-acetyltransferase [Fulvivirgaceae bacterium PWU5]|uniref:GNAT family N-acetyltransferase n=1 Tax=Dawidia cretensis TaxID=2782350 RepID=A0AAP2E119_9BACT|nr:GNAT family N-acetyltransferase [Dawidia cretensis]MBT1711170.1 GNAT family N-acetyltransferase [Dawidia cretensis]
MKINLEEIAIRIHFRPTDLGYVIYLHGKLYREEYGYGEAFEAYVSDGLFEFYKNYDPRVDRVWICEHQGRIVGFLLLMHRAHKTAQLRYFLLDREYRGIGLGRKLMDLYMSFLQEVGYSAAYLWTTDDLPAAAHLYMSYGFTLTEEKESMSFGIPLKERRYDLTLASKN